MDFKKHMIMKFNYITRIKELEDDNLYLANENMKLKKNIKNLKVEKEELEDDIIQLQYKKSKDSILKGSISKGSISKDKKKMSRVDISLQNLVRAREVKAQKFKLKKQSNPVPEPIPIYRPIQTTIICNSDSDCELVNEFSFTSSLSKI